MTSRTRPGRAGLSVLAAAALAYALSGCVASDASAAAAAEADLEQAVLNAHERVLVHRSESPYLRGEEAAAALQYWLGLDDIPVTVLEDGRVSFVLPLATREIQGGGWTYSDVSVGLCAVTEVEPGDGGEDRGAVTTEVVDCPEGMVPQIDGHTAEIVELDMEIRDDVPPPSNELRGCFGGDDCPGG